MLTTLMKKVLGSRNDRTLKRMQKNVVAINALEPTMKSLSDAKLSEKTATFKKRYAAGEGLDTLLPEAFAVVREAALCAARRDDPRRYGHRDAHDGSGARPLRTAADRNARQSA